MLKDIFSTQAEIYSRYRPSYPKELIEYILQFVKQKKTAWDCATGNGQAAIMLADHFEKVFATDFSDKQLSFAKLHPNIEYKIGKAEQTGFQDDTFDLITVAQAYHWFRFDEFEKEAKRVGKKGSVIAVWGYNLMTAHDTAIDSMVRRFYFDIVGPYWDKERKFVDENYSTVPFNFKPLPTKKFFISAEWDKNDFSGYLNSWSSVQRWIREKHTNPVDQILPDLDRNWIETKKVSFPLFLKLGIIK